MHNCVFKDNVSYDFNAASCSDPSNILNAENNYWGAADSATIALYHVYDHDDDSESPTVDFMPFLSESVYGGITGTVVDESHNPIAGVEVTVEGTSVSGMTNIDGQYSLGGLETAYLNVSFTHPDYRDTTISGVFVVIGGITTLDLMMQTPCPYVLGDFNGNGIASIADLVAAFSRLRIGFPEPALLCECPSGGGILWAVAMDVNNSCEFNIADIIIMFSKLTTGSPELIPCDECLPLRKAGRVIMLFWSCNSRNNLLRSQDLN